MVTMTSADNALKTLYLGVITEQLNTSVNPFLAKIKQTTSDVWGKEIRKLAQYGINGGVGAGTEDGSLPAASGNNYEQFVLSLKNLYGTIEISDKAIRASENNVGAFVNLLNAEMEGLLKASAYNFGRMLFGDGKGVLTTVDAFVDSNNLTLACVKNLVEGMIIDFRTATGAAISQLAGRKVLSVDRATKTVTFSGNAINPTLAPQGTLIVVQGSYNMEITGLKAIFSDTGSIYGLSRTTNKWLIPYIKENLGGITELDIQAAIDYLDEAAGSKVDFILCSSGVKRALQKHLASFKRNIDVMDLAGGYKAISYNGIPIVSDRFCPKGTMFLLNSKDFELHQLCDWKWLESENGRVITQVPGKAMFTATLVKYADLICNKPAGQGKITSIVES